MRTLLIHGPHVAVIVGGFVFFYWRWYLMVKHPPPPPPPAEVERRRIAEEARRRARRVRTSAARRGLAALAPLLGAAATGAVIYGIDLGRREAGAAVVWVHVGISLLATLLVAYKLADSGLERLRRRLATRPFETGATVVLAALLAPLLVTGIVLLVAPSDRSFSAYAHLVASGWWTVLLLWHLRRYLVRSVATLLDARREGRGRRAPGRDPAEEATAPAGPAPVVAIGSPAAGGPAGGGIAEARALDERP